MSERNAADGLQTQSPEQQHKMMLDFGSKHLPHLDILNPTRRKCNSDSDRTVPHEADTLVCAEVLP